MLLHTFYDDGWRMHWWVKKGKWNVWVVSNSSQNQRLLIDPARGDGIDGLDFEQTRHEEFSGAIPHDIWDSFCLHPGRGQSSVAPPLHFYKQNDS